MVRRVVALGLVGLLVVVTLVAARRVLAAVRPVTVTTSNGMMPARPRAIRVGAYNIAHGRGATDDNFAGGDSGVRAARLAAIADFLRSLDLDIVVLNEVDFNSLWSGGVDQSAVIADAASYAYVARQANLDVGLGPLGVRFGNAVLSRWPIVAARGLSLPARSTFEALAAGRKLSAVVSVDIGGTVVRVVPVHLEHRDEATRLASVAAMLELSRDNGAPLIALGDFNSGPAGWPLTSPVDGVTAVQRALDGGLRTAVDVGTPVGLSFPAWAPNRRLDWVLVAPPLAVSDDEVGGGHAALGGAGATPLSDHLAVWATVHLPPPAPLAGS